MEPFRREFVTQGRKELNAELDPLTGHRVVLIPQGQITMTRFPGCKQMVKIPAGILSQIVHRDEAMELMSLPDSSPT